MEAVSLLLEVPDVTVYEVRDGDLLVRGSTAADEFGEPEPDAVAREALAEGETVSRPARDGDPAALAVPEGVVEETVVVVVARCPDRGAFDDEFVRPLEILASHAATATSNIRSRERLERARRDLETRKEMVEMYDRLLRHDIGNDLQVISGHAEVLAAEADDEQSVEYAETIERTATGAADLIDRVGDVVSTLEADPEPEPRPLRPLLAGVVEDVAGQYESLSVSVDPAEFEYRVSAGDLLDSVFSNVLSNAAVHNDGPVAVRVYAEEPDPDTVVVGMADDGSGIPPEVRDEVFEMGIKGPDSDGTGFGLGFVRALVEAYGGSVAVGESPEGGADVRVALARA